MAHRMMSINECRFDDDDDDDDVGIAATAVVCWGCVVIIAAWVTLMKLRVVDGIDDDDEISVFVITVSVATVAAAAVNTCVSIDSELVACLLLFYNHMFTMLKTPFKNNLKW